MSGLQYFPQTMPANTVVGRISATAGATEAIPFSKLFAAFNGLPIIPCGTAGGTANALTLTTPTSITITGYTTGQVYLFKSGASANTGAATVAVNALAAIAIQVKQSACIGSEIQPNTLYALMLDSATTAQIWSITENVTTGKFKGDQFALSNDTSPYRRGSWPTTASGALYTLLGDFAMEYWTHNTAVDASGNFLGRDDTGTCTFGAFTESGLINIYNAVTAAAGVVPTFTLVYSLDTNTGTMLGTASAKLQTITATVAASALTIGIPSSSFDFRSATLTSGAVTTLATGPLSLVVPSTATLGTVNAVQSRLIVLAINNAGTVELAVVNIAGGNDLSETGVISTNGIAAGSNMASMAYSTAARNTVAYRVIGYVESTQATAGTWATAPSTIQGAGGNALTAMSSLGYGQTWQTVTGSRALNTTYYNTTGKPIVVNIVSSTSAAAFATLTINGVAVYGSYSSGAGSSANGLYVVPPNASYIASNTTQTLTVWTELR